MDNYKKTDIRDAGDQILKLCSEADDLLSYLQKLTEADAASELDALILRLRRLKISFEKTAGNLQKMEEQAGEDTPEGKMALQFRAMAVNELRWIGEMLETLEDNKKSLSLSENMKQQAFAARLKSKLV